MFGRGQVANATGNFVGLFTELLLTYKIHRKRKKNKRYSDVYICSPDTVCEI